MMTTLPILTVVDAPPEVAALLRTVEARYGFVPNLLGMLAHAPATLRAYLQLGDLLAGSNLSPAEQQVVALAVSRANACSYCMAAHSRMAAAVLDHATIQALPEGHVPADPRLAALAALAEAITQGRGQIDAGLLSRFVAAGYRPELGLDVLLIVAMKTLSNSADHLYSPPLDTAFASSRWISHGHGEG